MNEACDDWPAAARAQWLALLSTLALNEYPETEAPLAEALARRLGAPAGGVMLGPSSGALLDHIAMAGVRPGDRVAFPDPGFSLYPLLVRRHGGQSVRVPVGRQMPLDGFLREAERGARQLWITVPNNPTGAWISPDKVRSLLLELQRLRQPPLVVLDEAYAEFSPRTLRLLLDSFEHVLLLRTFSKALGSAGLRLGAVIGHPELVRELNAVKMPYSLSSPQLAALQVALEHAAEFEQSVRRTEERRDRLRTALLAAGFDVNESASNFLHLAEDVSATLEAQGILARKLPPGQGTRLSIATESVTAKLASALGAKLAAPQEPAARPLLVLDVDGVLIDAEQSFCEAVRLTVAELSPELLWRPALFRAMKRLGGMNNDFKLAAGLCAVQEQQLIDTLLQGNLRWNDALETAAMTHLARATERVTAHYAETKKSERALIGLAELTALDVPFAIFTGRNEAELADAYVTLGFTCEAVCDRAAHLQKPSPAGLLQLADSFRASHIVYVGDTRDDRASLVAARALRPQTLFCFAGVGPDRESFVRDDDLQAESLRVLLTQPTTRFALRPASAM
jgi:histidinol-phosphate aminotransferase